MGCIGGSERGMNRGSNILIDWLAIEGPNQSSLGSLIRLYSQRLLVAGVPVDRAFLGTLMIHPQAAAYTFFYEAEGDVLRELEISHEQYQILDAQKGTPMSHIETATPLRARLRLGEDHHMADLSALSEQGYTDYLALPIRIGDTVKAGMGWATRSSGFSDEDIQIQPRRIRHSACSASSTFNAEYRVAYWPHTWEVMPRKSKMA